MKPLLSIVVTGHGSSPSPGMWSLLQSLNDQRRYIDAPHSRNPEIICPLAKAVDWGNELPEIEVIFSWDGKAPNVIPFSLSKFETQFISNPRQGGCGHHTRGPGIEAANGSWIYLTNCDNMLVHGWLDYVHRSMLNPHVGGIIWNCINNLWGWTDLGGSKLKRGNVDLSCAMFRAEYVKKVGWPWTEYDSDFDYLKACSDLVTADKQYIDHFGTTLAIHN